MENQPAAEPTTSSKKKDFYEVLGVPKDATTVQIKKSYYFLSLQYHPDKNPNNPQAEEMFKLISEAYHILSDDEKRKTYDMYGMSGLQDGGEVDPREIFNLMFGGGKFMDIFGETSFATIFDPKFMEMNQLEQQFHIEKSIKDRNQKLVENLLMRIDSYVNGQEDIFLTTILNEANDRKESPGGPALLHAVGYVYANAAAQHLGRFFGIEGLFAEMHEKGHFIKETFKVISSTIELKRMADKMEALEEKENEAGNETDVVNAEQIAGMMQKGLNVIWRAGLLEIEATVRRVCETVLDPNTVPKPLLKKRGKALLEMGKLFKKK